MTKKIHLKDLVCMNDLAERFHFRIDIAYARKDNLLFGEQIYRKDAKLWMYKTLARVVCSAALSCYDKHKYRFILYDGLRPIEAQEAMMKTRRARKNPHWMEPPRLLSTPGTGGHPRGMAIDVGLEDKKGKLLDMGCPFDFLAENAAPEHNPAHRESEHSQGVQQNRAILDSSMIKTAESLEVELFPLPEEWWDFRLPPSVYREYEPLSESDLLEEMKMMV